MDFRKTWPKSKWAPFVNILWWLCFNEHCFMWVSCAPFKETNAFGALNLMLSLFKILNPRQIFSPACFPRPPPRLAPRAQLWERHQHQHQRPHLHKYLSHICLFIHPLFFQILTCGQKSRVNKAWAAAVAAAAVAAAAATAATAAAAATTAAAL